MPPLPALTVIVADPSPATAVGAGGVPGAVPEAAGLTEPDAGEALEVPVALVAVAEKVYAVPLLRPVTVHEPDAPVTVQVFPPGEAVTR